MREQERLGVRDTWKLGDIKAERQKRDLAVGDGMANFWQGQQLRRELLSVKEACVKERLQFGGGILLDMNRGEVPHAGKESRDVSGVGGTGRGLRRREKKSASARIDEDERGESEFNAGPFGAFFGNDIGEADFPRLAKFGDGAKKTLRRARSAKSGAEFHHGLVPIAGSTRGEERICGFLKLLPALAGAKVAANGAEPGENPCDVAVEDREFLAIGYAENRSGGVIADAGQGESFFKPIREFGIVAGDDLLSRLLKIARARVVAETGPETKHFFFRGFGEGLNVGKAREELFIVRNHGNDSSLLEHDFGKPDAVRIFRAAPGKIAPELGEPGQKVFAEARE